MFKVSDDRALVATVDFFTPIVDDARTFGAIAAANALSDLYAMGAQPMFALNLVGWPRDAHMLELLGETLDGGAEVVTRAGAFILGGHSIDDNEPKYGLVALGEAHPDRLVRTSGAKALPKYHRRESRYSRPPPICLSRIRLPTSISTGLVS